MKKARAIAVVMFLCVYALGLACSSQNESANGGAEASETPLQPAAPAAAQAALDPQTLPDLVARVNDTEITKAELIARAQSIQGQLPPGTAGDSLDFYRRVLDDLVTSELLYQSSKSKGFLPSEAEVEAQINQIRARFPDPQQFQQVLQAQGLTEEALRERMRRDLGVQKLVEGELSAEIEVSEAQKQAFYQENTEQMQEPDQVRVSHILVMADENATEEQRAQAKKKTEDLRARAVAGEGFAALARENSDDPGSKANGGELPWMSRGDTVPPFEEAAFALSPGEMSEVVQTRYGYHVIKLAERKEGGTIPYERAQEQIEKFLRDQAVRDRIITEVGALKAAADVEIFI